MAQDGLALKRSFYPEANIGGFSNVDGTLSFFSHIAELVGPESIVMEFGAGRGANVSEIRSSYLRRLQNFKGRCAKVIGCDIDKAVLENPFLDEAHVITPNGRLPFDDATFDVVVSSWVFEHIANPEVMAAELLRVTKPGGYICACTPNKAGYVSIMGRLVSSSKHVPFLTKIQPERKSIDVFPTEYKLNSQKDIERYFGRNADVMIGRTFSEPAYHFNNKMLYRIFYTFHNLLPKSLCTTLHVYIRKHG